MLLPSSVRSHTVTAVMGWTLLHAMRLGRHGYFATRNLLPRFKSAGVTRGLPDRWESLRNEWKFSHVTRRRLLASCSLR